MIVFSKATGKSSASENRIQSRLYASQSNSSSHTNAPASPPSKLIGSYYSLAFLSLFRESSLLSWTDLFTKFPWIVQCQFAWSKRCSQETRCPLCCCSTSTLPRVQELGRKGFRLDLSCFCFPMPALSSCQNQLAWGCRSQDWSKKLRLQVRFHYFLSPTWCWKA